jgi:hypothetical protein
MFTMQLTATNIATPVYSLRATFLLTFTRSIGRTISKWWRRLA